MTLTRLHDWPERLNEFIAVSREKEFSYGSLDCALFVCDAVQVMTGTDLALAYRGKYHDQDSAEQILQNKNLLRIALDVAKQHDMLQYERPAVSPRGSVLLLHKPDAAMEFTLALNDGRFALCPLVSGLAYVRLEYAVRAWKV